MELMTTDFKTNIFIQSEAEFNQAKIRGWWDRAISLLTGRRANLLPFSQLVDESRPNKTTLLGIQDIPVTKIVGSVGRSRDFTAHFLPAMTSAAAKERWRKIYTLAATGHGFPPIVVYKVGDSYFVEDGHHRVSVATYLGWKTIQAKVIVIEPPGRDDRPQWSGGNRRRLCFQL
jgi:hypothetical protein